MRLDSVVLFSPQHRQARNVAHNKVKLTEYEMKVLEMMLAPIVEPETWATIMSKYSVKNFESNQNAGYFLTIQVEGLNLSKETISEPNVMGAFSSYLVGFILFVERDQITIECHDYGNDINSSNLRIYDFEIRRE